MTKLWLQALSVILAISGPGLIAQVKAIEGMQEDLPGAQEIGQMALCPGSTREERGANCFDQHLEDRLQQIRRTQSEAAALKVEQFYRRQYEEWLRDQIRRKNDENTQIRLLQNRQRLDYIERDFAIGDNDLPSREMTSRLEDLLRDVMAGDPDASVSPVIASQAGNGYSLAPQPFGPVTQQGNPSPSMTSQGAPAASGGGSSINLGQALGTAGDVLGAGATILGAVAGSLPPQGSPGVPLGRAATPSPPASYPTPRPAAGKTNCTMSANNWLSC